MFNKLAIDEADLDPMIICETDVSIFVARSITDMSRLNSSD